MSWRRAWLPAVLIAAAAWPAAAQWPAAQQQPQTQWPAPPPAGQAPQITVQPTQPQAQAPSNMQACAAEFVRLRNETEGKAKAIRAAGDRHAPAKEACGLFNNFIAAENKLIKYATDNAVWCSIPAQIVDQMKKGHGQALQMRTKICDVANRQPAAPRQPTLSDALGAPVPDSNNIRTGRGTFDTLTGTPLGQK